MLMVTLRQCTSRLWLLHRPLTRYKTGWMVGALLQVSTGTGRRVRAWIRESDRRCEMHAGSETRVAPGETLSSNVPFRVIP